MKDKDFLVCRIARGADEAEKLKAYGQEPILKIKAEREGPTLLNNLAAPPHPGRPKAKSLQDILPPRKVNLADVAEEKRLIEGIHEVAGQLYDDVGFGDIRLAIRLLRSSGRRKAGKDYLLCKKLVGGPFITSRIGASKHTLPYAIGSLPL